MGRERHFVNIGVITLLVVILTASNSLEEFNKQSNTSQMPEVHQGDLIFRRTDSTGSQFVDRLDSASIYSHVGLAYTNPAGDVFVIHVLPLETDTVRIEPLEKFINEAVFFAVYRPIGIDLKVLDAAVQNGLSWVGKRHFDKNFDLQTDDYLYCTELVYKAYKEAGLDILNGETNVVDFPFIEVREVIFPSLIVKNGPFVLLYSNVQEGGK